MVIALPVLVCIVGLILYIVVDAAKFPKLVHIADVMFWVGLFVSLLNSNRIIEFLGGH